MTARYAPPPLTCNPHNAIVDICESRLSVHIECSNLRNMDFIGRSDPFALLFLDSTGASNFSAVRQPPPPPDVDDPASSSAVSFHPLIPPVPPALRAGSARGTYPGRDSVWLRVGRTETVPNSLDVAFAKSFEIPYFFERSQKLAVDVFDSDVNSERDEDIHSHDYLGSAEVSVPSLVRARGKRLTVPLRIEARPTQRCGFVTLIVEEISLNKQRLNYDMQIHGVSRGLRTLRSRGPFLTILRKHAGRGADDPWIVVFRTEAPGTALAASHNAFNLGKLTYNYEKFCLCNDHEPLRFDVSYRRSGKHDVVATATCTLAECDAAGGVIQLGPVKAGLCGTVANPSRKLLLRNRSVVHERTFLDYVTGGCEISLVVAIDYTASNGNPSLPGTLHFADSMRCNEYEMAVRAVGDILAAYDTDQMIPAYGFGAKLPPDFPHPVNCFSLTNSPDPACHTVDQVLNMYRQTLYNVRLSGPTVFAEVIQAGAMHAEDELNRHEQSYTILLIVTDGQINDIDDTLAQIALASSLPLSIVIIGVGGQDFSSMVLLDGDDLPNERDIVQFVNFRQFKDTPEVLQSQVLEEIPRQFLQYMEMHGIEPMPPPVE